MIRHLSVATAICILFAGSSRTDAQTRICVVDIAKVFQAHSTFTSQMQALKADADQFQSKLQSNQERIARMNEDLRLLDATTQEYRTKETELAQLTANLELERRNKVRDLMQQEADAHFAAYAEITRLIGAYCQEKSVSIVIRYNSQPMSLDNPASIEDAFNNNVIYASAPNDITGVIIDRLASSVTPPTNR